MLPTTTGDDSKKSSREHIRKCSASILSWTLLLAMIGITIFIKPSHTFETDGIVTRGTSNFLYSTARPVCNDQSRWHLFLRTLILLLVGGSQYATYTC